MRFRPLNLLATATHCTAISERLGRAAQKTVTRGVGLLNGLLIGRLTVPPAACYFVLLLEQAFKLGAG